MATGVLFVAFSSILVALPGCAGASAITPERVVELVNADRSTGGLAALKVDAQLAQAAEAKGRDMVAHDYFAHTSPEGRTPWNWIEGAGYGYHYAGENLAIRFTDAEEEQSAWMASPTHRANIMSDHFVDIGVAVVTKVESGHPVFIVVQEFGSRPGAVLPGVLAKPAVAAAQSVAPPVMRGTDTSTSADRSSWWSWMMTDGKIYGISVFQLSLMVLVSFGEVTVAVFFGRAIRSDVHHQGRILSIHAAGKRVPMRFV